MKPLILLFIGCLCFSSVRAETFETVHTFPTVPLLPYSSLLRGLDGNFYGSSGYGGARNWGTIYRVTPAGEISVVLSFSYTGGPVPGGRPLGLIQDAAGMLYGITFDGGAAGL